MTRKVYRTAQGKMVDIGALQLRNENVRAVGNMSVNARGDLIDHQNKPIETRPQQVAKSYRRQTGNVSDTSVHNAKQEPKKAKKTRAEPAAVPVEVAAASPVSEATARETANKPLTGLAAAIAKARQVKQEEIRSPQQMAEHQQKNTRA